MGVNMTDTFATYLRENVAKTRIGLNPSALILHPLYEELQEQSPMGVGKDYTLAIYDVSNEEEKKKYL